MVLQAALQGVEVELHGGERLADLVVQLAGDVAALLLLDLQHAVGQRLQAQAGLVQLALALAPRAADGRLLHLALDGGAEAGVVALDQVVVGAGLHGGDGDVLADVAGDDDEGHVGIELMHLVQRQQAGVVGQGVVGEDDRPGAFAQGARHALGVLHAAVVRRVAGAAQGQQQQVKIVGRIFDDQDVDGAQRRERERLFSGVLHGGRVRFDCCGNNTLRRGAL